MGDHKASIKIEAEFHGVKRSLDSYRSYSGWRDMAQIEGVDDGIVEFFQELWHAGMAAYEQQMWEWQREDREREQEKKDRAEFERLKAKYEGGQP